MTLSALYGVEDGHPQERPDRLRPHGQSAGDGPLRHAEADPRLSSTTRAATRPRVNDALTALYGLLDAIIDRLADELEDVGAEIEKISAHIFAKQSRRSAHPGRPADRAC